jgi:hypothetical protein
MVQKRCLALETQGISGHNQPAQITETETEYDPDSIPINHEAEFTHQPI